MRIIYRLLFGLHLFVGIGAIAGGLAAIINPETPLGAPTAALKNSPFSNYLIPGIILFAIIGLGNIISAVILKLRLKVKAYSSNVVGWALVIWIVVQCIMLQAVVFIHVLFFLIGFLQGGLALVILFKERLFPANIIMNFSRNYGSEDKTLK